MYRCKIIPLQKFKIQITFLFCVNAWQSQSFSLFWRSRSVLEQQAASSVWVNWRCDWSKVETNWYDGRARSWTVSTRALSIEPSSANSFACDSAKIRSPTHTTKKRMKFAFFYIPIFKQKNCAEKENVTKNWKLENCSLTIYVLKKWL